MFGLASNPKFTGVTKVEDFNRPEITMAYFSGAGEEPLVREQFSKAKLRGVANSGSVAPIEEVLAGRSDVAPLNRMLWPSISKKVKGLAVFPKDNNCRQQDLRDPGRHGRGQEPARVPEWLRKVEARMHPELAAEERRMTLDLK